MRKIQVMIRRIIVADSDPMSIVSALHINEPIRRLHFGMNVIEAVQTEWVALIVFGQKKDASLRFLIDYRKLNSLTYRTLLQYQEGMSA